MLSLSDNEFSVISFLVRNFTERLTIRNIAKRLGFSAAGVFNILKKLEKENIVAGQKLGTGLFYSMNFDSKVSRHLAAIVLAYPEEKVPFDIEKLNQAKAAIFDKNSLLLVTDNVTTLDAAISNVNVIVKTKDEFIGLLRKKDAEMLQLLRKGTALFGEDEIVSMIKSCVSGF